MNKVTVPKIEFGYRIRHKAHYEWVGILKNIVADGSVLWCGVYWLKGNYKIGILPYWNNAKDIEPDMTAWWLNGPNILFGDGKRIFCLGTEHSIAQRGGVVDLIEQWQSSLSLEQKPIDISKLKWVNPNRVDPSDLVVDLTGASIKNLI